MTTYTYVSQRGDSILCRGFYSNGERFDFREEYQPTLFLESRKQKNGSDTVYYDIHGTRVYEMKPGSIGDCRDFLERYKDVEGFTVHGMTSWITQYTSDKFPGEYTFDSTKTRIFFFDIETTIGNSFPDPAIADQEILLITVYDSVKERYVVYSSRELSQEKVKKIASENNVSPDTIYFSVSNTEQNMLKNFVTDWANSHPDAITGWNIETFDIPYLVNRIAKILGDSFVSKLSPWGRVRARTIHKNDQEIPAFDIDGVAMLDYLALMKKFTYGDRESWKLGDVAYEELEQTKLEFECTFKEAYTLHYDEFTAYNIIDTALVKKIDDKMKLIELIYTIAYMAKVNPDDVYSPIRTWDSLIYNYLKKKNIVVPLQTRKNSTSQIAGGYVKDPQVGKHMWFITVDLASLYPHIMMNTNISPETITDIHFPVSVDELLTRNVDTSFLKERNISLAGNGWTFSREKRGFVPEIIETMYSLRSATKKQMLNIEQEFETTGDVSLVPKISSLNNKQMAVKILMNSLFGGMANQYFRFFDNRLAEGITLTGQLGIQWVAQDINKFLNKVNNTTDVDYIIYTDTDSAMVSLKSVVEKHRPDSSTEDRIKFMLKFSNDVLQKVINKSYDEMKDYLNSYEQKFVMKVEKIGDSGIWVAKKRYALNVHNSEGVQYATPKIKVTGLEMVRSSTPHVVRDSLKDGIKQVLYGDEKSVRKFVKDYKIKYKQEPVEKIAFPRGVNGLQTYTGSPIYAKGCPIHVRAALLYNHYIKKLGLENRYELIGEGSKMKFVYLKLPNPFKENVIGYVTKLPPEFKLHEYVDYDTMFNKSFEDAMTGLIKPLNWTLDDFATLDDLFG